MGVTGLTLHMDTSRHKQLSKPKTSFINVIAAQRLKMSLSVILVKVSRKTRVPQVLKPEVKKYS